MKYSITNRPFTMLTMHLEEGEAFRSKPGAMAWMSSGIRMETKIDTFGSAIRKISVGRAPLYSRFFARQAGEVSLARQNPGDILMFDVSETPVIIQKLSFLACTEDVTLDVYIHQNVATGIFSGTGFLMEKYSGTGCVWIGLDGSLVIRELAENEILVVGPGFVNAMETTCSMEIRWVKGVDNMVLGGEGLFHTVIRGPGKVWLQSMPLHKEDDQIPLIVDMVTSVF